MKMETKKIIMKLIKRVLQTYQEIKMIICIILVINMTIKFKLIKIKIRIRKNQQ